MSNILYVKNWSEWQSYRKDRGTPPWIKVHRNLMSSPKWAELSDAEKGHLVSIWIVAADSDGKVSSNANVLRKQCQLDDLPNLEKFQELDFLSTTCQPVDSHDAPIPPQHDAPETEAYREETETKTEREPLPNFEDLIFGEEFLKVATENGLSAELGAKSFEVWKRTRSPNPPKDLLGNFWIWCMKEKKPPESPATAKPLEGRSLLINQVGVANWKRKMGKALDGDEQRRLGDWEKKYGAVTWNNFDEWKKQQASP